MTYEYTEPAEGSHIILITGAREYPRPDLIRSHLIPLNNGPSHLICGMARGTDMVAYDFANEQGWTIDKMPVTSEEWKSIGNSAGHRRNRDMVRRFQELRAKGFTGHILGFVLFPEKRSKGTHGCIRYAYEQKPIIPIITVDEHGQPAPLERIINPGKWLAKEKSGIHAQSPLDH